MREDETVTILGGSIAALAVANEAHRSGLPYQLYAPEAQWAGSGGTCQSGKFFFDFDFQCMDASDPRTLGELRSLLGRDCLAVSPTVALRTETTTLELPSRPHRLLWGAGPATLLASGLQVATTSWMSARMGRGGPSTLRRSLRIRYGTPLSARFLSGYFEKLWGGSWGDIDAVASGRYGWPVEPASWSGSKRYYPAFGMGQVADLLVAGCDKNKLHSGIDLMRVMHNGTDVHGLEVARGRRVSVDELLIAVPLPHLVQLFDPAPPPEVLRAAKAIRYRHKLLVALFVDRPQVTRAACTYFEQAGLSISRLFEPRNLSPFAAPLNKSLVVAEIWCDDHHPLWQSADDALETYVTEQLADLGILNRDQTFGAQVIRLPDFVPIPDYRYVRRLTRIADWLGRFRNVRLYQPGSIAENFSVIAQLRAGKQLAQQVRRDCDEARLLTV